MITLHQPPPAWGLPNVSPFCVKLETYLRMAGLAYEVKPPGMTLGPKRKIPYIRDGERVMGDSGLIIEYLRATYGDPLDGALDDRQRATAHAVRRMLEEHTYFVLLKLRWSNPDAWPHIKQAFAPLMPPLVGGAVMGHIRRGILRKTWEQGAGRHSDDELLGLLDRDLDAIDALMGDGPFFVGAEPTSVDATLYGFLCQLAYVPWDSDEKARFRAHGRLVAYVDRMRARYWGDPA